MSLLTQEQIVIRDLARGFVRKEVIPFAAEWGGGGADFTSYVLATEELAYGDAGVCNMVSATNGFAMKLRDFGTPAQKERFLRPVASGAEIACLLLTKPQAGSDLANQPGLPDLRRHQRGPEDPDQPRARAGRLR